jgi:pimeloyl-ACP methyl ester carboxylesterase
MSSHAFAPAAVVTRRVRAAGVDTHLFEVGEGPPTFMAHGNPDSGDQWLPNEDRRRGGCGQRSRRAVANALS